MPNSVINFPVQPDRRESPQQVARMRGTFEGMASHGREFQARSELCISLLEKINPSTTSAESSAIMTRVAAEFRQLQVMARIMGEHA